MNVISSRRNPAVRAFRELARSPDPEGARVLLDGVHLVRDARAAGVLLEVVAVANTRMAGDTEEGRLARALEADGAHVLAVDEHVFASLSPVRTPSGIAAIARRTPVRPDAIAGLAGGFVLVAADVQDPGNLGSLVRAAEAGGADGVLVCGASTNPFSWKAIRGSMGSTLRLPVAAGATVEAVVRNLRSHAGRILAAVPRGGRDPDDVNWRGRTALLLGGEGPGLSGRTLAEADELVTIPMSPPVESLNVAVAAGILVYAARRQRT